MLTDLRDHDDTEFHKNATIAAANIKLCYSLLTNKVDHQLNQMKAKMHSQNMNVLESIVECVIFCGKKLLWEHRLYLMKIKTTSLT